MHINNHQSSHYSRWPATAILLKIARRTSTWILIVASIYLNLQRISIFYYSPKYQGRSIVFCHLQEIINYQHFNKTLRRFKEVRYLGQYPLQIAPDIENECDTEAVEEYTFRLPNLPLGGCLIQPAPYEMTALYPNPFTNSLTVEYDTEVTGCMDIYLFPSGSGSDILLSSEYVSAPGSYQEVMNTSSVPTGTYFLVLSLDGAIISTTAIKI